MKVDRYSLLFALVLGLVAGPAFAQVPPKPAPAKPGVKPLKPGALPSPPRVKRPAKPIAGKGKGKAGEKGARPGPATRPGSRFATKRRTPPGAAPAAAKDEKEPPRWQTAGASEDKEDAEPTLSKDFIQNCPRLKPGVKVNLDIVDDELDDVVKLISCLTGKNIIMAKSLKGKKITIYSPSQVTAREAYRAFLTALEANGFTISKQGSFLRIIDIKDYPRSPDPILSEGRALANEDQMVTQIIQLDHIDAAEVNDVLTPLASPHASVIVYAPNNSLIITELSSNLRKLRGLIDQLDVPGGQEELWVYQVINAEASDIATKITEIFEEEAAAKSKTRSTKTPRKGKGKSKAPTKSEVGDSELDARVSKVIADERTNRLLIVASRRSYRKIKALIEKLDIAIPGDGQIHILQLNNAKASELSSVLSNLSSEARNRRQGSANRRSSNASRRSSANAAGGDSAALFEGEVSITADEATNALVITASLKDFLALKRVVDELDKPRRQVFIEAVVMEVTINNNREFGIASHVGAEGPTVEGKRTGIIFSNQNGTNSPSSTIGLDALSLTGIGFRAEDLEILPGVSLPPLGVVLRALAGNRDINVLSTPHILTTDNEEAEIVVGDTIPFEVNPFGSTANLGSLLGSTGATAGLNTSALGLGSGLGLSNIQRQDVALTLRITPRINAENTVTLEIDQEIEELGPNVDELGRSVSKRSIKSTVIVGDQSTVVIGGLQKTKQTNSKTGFPILSEIPVLGYLFRNEQTENDRVNLLLLLTPYVIEGPDDFRAIFNRKMEEHREFVARFRKGEAGYSLGVDYGKKHGMLESINQSIKKVRGEEALLEELRRREQGPPLPQDLDGLDAENGEPEDGTQADVDGEIYRDEALAVEFIPARLAPADVTDEEAVR